MFCYGCKIKKKKNKSNNYMVISVRKNIIAPNSILITISDIDYFIK